MATPGPGDREWVCVEGILSNKRIMGKRLVFVDVKRPGGLAALLDGAAAPAAGSSSVQDTTQSTVAKGEGDVPTACTEDGGAGESIPASAGRKRKRDEVEGAGNADGKHITEESKDLIECCFSADKFQDEHSERAWPTRPQDLTLGDEIRVEGVLRAKDAQYGCTLEVMRWALLKPFDHSYRFQPSRRVSFRAPKPLSARARRRAVLEHEGGVNVHAADPAATAADGSALQRSTVSSRARIFSDFLAEHMGTAALATGVLDIAGGKGFLAWELQVRRGIRATVIDPRPMAVKLPRRMRKELRKRCGDGAAGPMHVCGMFDDAFVSGEGVTLTAQQRGKEGETTLDTAARRALVHDAGVVVGMHPDEATEPIVDMALKLNKPFAVVPCCVFAALFPHRRLRGEPVVAYDDFVDYLQAKHPSIRRATLPMDGRRIVLYRTPKDVDTEASDAAATT